MSKPTVSGISAPEAERNLLTALIRSPLALDSLPNISPLDFSNRDYRAIIASLLELRKKDIKPDRVTINEQVTKYFINLKRDRPESLTQELINEICDDQVPFGIHEDYYRLLVEKTVLRSVVSFCERQSRAAYEFGIGDDLSSFLSKMEERVMRFRDANTSNSELKDGRRVMKEASTEIEEHSYSTSTIAQGIMSGIKELDFHTSGLQKGEVTIIAARPSCGKTALLLHLALYASLHESVNVGLFSLEMNARSLMERCASMISGVGTKDVRRNQTTSQERQLWIDSYKRVREGSITIDDSNDLNIEDIRARARRMKISKNVSFIGIDYLQLIKPDTSHKYSTTEDMVGNISRSVKQMARELDIPVVLLAQFNREPEKREDRLPRLSDIRGSGAIEQDADQVWAIHREFGIESDGFDILSLKGRNTGIFNKIELLFDGETQRLSSLGSSFETLLAV